MREQPKKIGYLKHFSMNLSALNLTVFAWQEAKWTAALRRVPALLAILGLSFWSGELTTGVVAAGACLSVGMLGNRQIMGSNLAAILCLSLVTALSAWAGTLVGNSAWLNPLVTAGWGLIFAFLTVHDEDSGWIAMQGVIALVIAMAFPSHGWAALERSGAVFAGGLLQTTCLAIAGEFRTRTSNEKGPPANQPSHLKTFRWKEFTRSFTFLSVACQYAFRVAMTLIIATEIARHLAIRNSYWLPMTLIVILKPDFYRTYSGAIQRVLGTFIGVMVASLITHAFHPGMGLLFVLIAVFSFGCFALVKVNSVLFSASLTG